MIDLIDRKEVLQRLCAACSNMGSFVCMSCTIPGIVNGIPKIESEPVRHGMWKWENGYVGTMAVCSVCGSSPLGFYSLPKNQIGRLPVYKYCPRCGAQMKGAKK